MSESSGRGTSNGAGLAEAASCALERVCSGRSPDSAPRYYSPDFVDYVNDMRFRGHEGILKSVGLYTKVLSDVDIRVEEQLEDGDRVTSRFVVTGSSFGRRVRFNGMTISRFKDGLIVEDHSVTDTLGMLRQLGVWRFVVLAARQWKQIITR
jgi:ketosteroid isomerase-like protein